MFKNMIIDQVILRVASAAYCLSMSIYAGLVFLPQGNLPEEVYVYMDWWYSQPMTPLESFASNVGMGVLILSVIFAGLILFLYRWAGYGFVISALILYIFECLVPSYVPQTGLSASINTLNSVVVGCIIAIILLSNKLGTFKHNKKVNRMASPPVV